MALEDAVQGAVQWALEPDAKPRTTALAELAVSLAKEIATGGTSEKPPPVAQLAKELRATLEDLEGLRDGDDAEASLGVVLSSPIWDTAQSG